MDQFDLGQWLMKYFATEKQKEADRQRKIAAMNAQVPRGPDGNILQQGIQGVYSDSLDFTLEDYIRTQKPDLWLQLQKPRKKMIDPWHVPQKYEGLI